MATFPNLTTDFIQAFKTAFRFLEKEDIMVFLLNFLVESPPLPGIATTPYIPGD